MISSCTLESTIGEPVAPQPPYIGIESIDTYFRKVLGYGFVNKYERTVGGNKEYRHVYRRYKWGLSQEISSDWQQSDQKAQVVLLFEIAQTMAETLSN